MKDNITALPTPRLQQHRDLGTRREGGREGGREGEGRGSEGGREGRRRGREGGRRGEGGREDGCTFSNVDQDSIDCPSQPIAHMLN